MRKRRTHAPRGVYVGLTMLIFTVGVFFTLGVSGQKKILDAPGLRDTLYSLADSTAKAQELSFQFAQDRITPNYFRIQMNSILRDLQISQEQLTAAEVGSPLAGAKQETLELSQKSISTIEQLRDSLFDKNLAKTDISIFEKITTESKKVAKNI